MHGKRILIIDDDPGVRKMMELVFTRAGAEVRTASDGQDGLRQFRAFDPHLIVLDVLMPTLDGWQTCAEIRRLSSVPIIFVTVLQREDEIVRGLDSGAVDYVTKPFKPAVLLARARAALRQAGVLSENQKPAVYDDGHLVVDLVDRRVRAGGQPVQLTATEYRLLAYLLENAGRVVTYEQILEHVWGWDTRGSAEYVHVYVWHLRQKLEPDPRHPSYILTERGVGYRFEPSALGPRERATSLAASS
jgi:two-component system KDP operon response regulator KdpE